MSAFVTFTPLVHLLQKPSSIVHVVSPRQYNARSKVNADKVDIYTLPVELAERADTITVGDLHGNTIKLLYFLFKYNVVRFDSSIKDPQSCFKILVTTYEQFGEAAEAFWGVNTRLSLIQNDITRHLAEINLHDMLRYIPFDCARGWPFVFSLMHVCSSKRNCTKREQKELARLDRAASFKKMADCKEACSPNQD